jgi:hypothetical protein
MKGKEVSMKTGGDPQKITRREAIGTMAKVAGGAVVGLAAGCAPTPVVVEKEVPVEVVKEVPVEVTVEVPAPAEAPALLKRGTY